MRPVCLWCAYVLCPDVGWSNTVSKTFWWLGYAAVSSKPNKLDFHKRESITESSSTHLPYALESHLKCHTGLILSLPFSKQNWWANDQVNMIMIFTYFSHCKAVRNNASPSTVTSHPNIRHYADTDNNTSPNTQNDPSWAYRYVVQICRNHIN